jgi:hypothetical protein
MYSSEYPAMASEKYKYSFKEFKKRISEDLQDID